MLFGGESDAEYRLRQLSALHTDAKHVAAGSVNMTIHGTYIGEYLDEISRRKMQEIALHHVARKTILIIAELRKMGIKQYGPNGKELERIDDVVAAFRSLYFVPKGEKE